MYEKTTIVYLLVMVLLATIVSGCVSVQDIDDELEKISAICGKKVADEIANDWSNNAKLLTIGSRTLFQAGFSTSWNYFYINNSNDENGSETLDVKVYGDLSYETSNRGLYKATPLTNWTLNSNEAYNISILNSTLSDYLNGTNGKAQEDGAVLFTRTNTSLGITLNIWSITWSHSGYLGFGQSYAKIEIDASTGEVLYVETPET